MVKNTYEEVKETFKELGYELISQDYSGKDKPLEYYCLKHKDKGVQTIKFKQILNGRKCDYCKKEMAEEKFKNKLYSIFPNLIITGKFTYMKSRVRVKCTIHDYEWEPYAYNLTSGFGCPLCGRERTAKSSRKPLDVILKELSEKQPNAHVVSDISKIKSTSSRVKMKCDICDTEWEATIANLTKKKNTTSCPNCSIERVARSCRKTLEQFQKETEELGSLVEPIGEYSNIHTPILCRCKIHKDKTFYQIPTTILNGSNSCPKCVPYKHEKEMLSVLDKYHLKYTPQKRFKDCKDKKQLPFDAYLDDCNIAIEYDGEGHYKAIPRTKNDDGSKSLYRTQKHDAIKTEYCKDNNIPLIRIPYWEQNNIETYLIGQLRKYIKIS